MANFILLIQEGVCWMPVFDYPRGQGLLRFDDLEKAKAEALRRVDDALPRNTVHVVADYGHAYFGGDGGSYWQEPRP